MVSRVNIVVPQKDFNDAEHLNITKPLLGNGVLIFWTGKKKTGAVSDKGRWVQLNMALNEVEPDFSFVHGIIILGGKGAQMFYDDPEAHYYIKKFYDAGKVVAGISEGVMVLALAGVLNGKKLTGPEHMKEELTKFGLFTDSNVEIDGTIVTCKGAEHMEEFTSKLFTNLEVSKPKFTVG